MMARFKIGDIVKLSTVHILILHTEIKESFDSFYTYLVLETGRDVKNPVWMVDRSGEWIT